MTLAHRLMDFGLWCMAILWLLQFIAEHLRKSEKRLRPPSRQCQRMADFDFDHRLNSMTRWSDHG